MLTTSTIPGTDIVTMTYDGALSAEAVTSAREQLSAASRGGSGARALLDVREVDLGNVEPKAMWEDLKGAGLLSDIDRVAVLTDSAALGGAMKAAGALTPLTAQVYDLDQRDEAVVWLQS